jgi:AcrR family transcriptional regulator
MRRNGSNSPLTRIGDRLLAGLPPRWLAVAERCGGGDPGLAGAGARLPWAETPIAGNMAETPDATTPGWEGLAAIAWADVPKAPSAMTSPGTGTSPRPQARRTGRRPGPSTTREQILAAARQSFARRGYDATSVNAVAAAAGVDPALVRRFFGSKEGLLNAALTAVMSPAERLAQLAAGSPGTLGERMIGYFFTVWEEPPNRDVMIGMIRSACTNEHAARLLQRFIAVQVLARLAGSIDDAEAQLRASMVGSQLVGLALVRHVVKIEPLASASPAALSALFGPTLQRYLTGDLNLPRTDTG